MGLIWAANDEEKRLEIAQRERKYVEHIRRLEAELKEK
jgi:hypothetical protein